MQANWIDEIEETAARRFPRWAPETWRAVVDGPARALVEALDETGRPVEQTRPVVENYLTLAAEAIGLGYLYPFDDTGRPNFCSLAWFELLPGELASLEPNRQTEVLSACWNVGENLEVRAAWFQALFLELMSPRKLSLETFEEGVRRVTASILEPPQEAVDGEDCRLKWIFLGEGDGRFLPGKVAFLAPRVAVVYHRHTGLDGDPKAAKIVWLGTEPTVLGGGGARRLGDAEVEEGANGGGGWDWERLRDEESRLTSLYASTHNRWRALCTLETSQFLVAACPRPPKDQH